MAGGKRAPHRLRLVPETLRTLSSTDVDRAVGGINVDLPRQSIPCPSVRCTFEFCNAGGGQ